MFLLKITFEQDTSLSHYVCLDKDLTEIAKVKNNLIKVRNYVQTELKKANKLIVKKFVQQNTIVDIPYEIFLEKIDFEIHVIKTLEEIKK